MPKIFTSRNNFNTGEISELASAREDIAKYNGACLTMENALPLVEGGAKKMPGTYFGGGTVLGGSMFTGSIALTTLTVTAVAYGNVRVGQTVVGTGVYVNTVISSLLSSSGSTTAIYPGETGTCVVSYSQTVASESMQTASSGKSRLVPFQFSTNQGAVVEIAAGVVRVWESSSPGDWYLGIAEQAPASALDYNPSTAYVAGQPSSQYSVVKIGPFVQLPINVSRTTTANTLTIAAPYGTNGADTVEVIVTVNSSDNLSVGKFGVIGNQGISIALANTTASKNTATAIQAAIRAIGYLNSYSSNYIDLTSWTVTPSPEYYAAPWTSLPVTGSCDGYVSSNSSNMVGICTQANQYNEFPLVASFARIFPGQRYYRSVAWNSAYWALESGSRPPIEITVPYVESDLFELDCSAQSADVLWIFHPNYPPACIERYSANSWKYSTSFPGSTGYRGTTDVVKTGYSALGCCIISISPTRDSSGKTGTSGPCVITAAPSAGSAPFVSGDRVYINNCSGTVELNQGEFILTSVSGPNANGNYTATLTDPDTGSTIDSSDYGYYTGGGFVVREVAMSQTAGNYPACGTLYQDRLCVGGADSTPSQMNGSTQGDYPEFITDPNADDHAIQFTLVSNKLDQIINMLGTPNSLMLGTAGGVWSMNGTNGGSLTQTNVSASKQTTMGVGNLQPQLTNDSAIFVSRSARIVMFLVYNFVSNQWDNYDLTRLNRDITLGPTKDTSGIVQTAFQVEPYPIFWAVRADGQLIGLVFNKQDQVYAWFRVDMTRYGGKVESVAVISGQDMEDEIAVVVNRTINGVTQRYFEYFMPQEMYSDLSNAFFVHSGQRWKGVGPFNITGIGNSSPVPVQVPGHNFVAGDIVQITGVVGMTEINQDKTQAYTVDSVTSDMVYLRDIDSTDFTPYVSGGTISQVTNQVSGVSYLIGQTATAVGDESLIMDKQMVTSDTITFQYYCNQIVIGIPYVVTIRPTNPVITTQTGTTKGVPQKLTRVTFSLYQSMQGKYGSDLNHMYDMTYGNGSMLKQPGMSTGEFTRDMDSDWSDESTIYVTQDVPFPFTLRAIVMRMSYNPD